MGAKGSVRVLRSSVLVGLILVGVGALWWNARPEPREKFCTLGLAFTTIDGQEVVLQDQGGPGRDGCDGNGLPSQSTVASGLAIAPVLGFDCKVRDVNGTVVATTTPNRPDGTCGQAPRRIPPGRP